MPMINVYAPADLFPVGTDRNSPKNSLLCCFAPRCNYALGGSFSQHRGLRSSLGPRLDPTAVHIAGTYSHIHHLSRTFRER